MINNRQAGRRRGRGGGNGGQRQGSNQGNGSRIDNRARGNANQLYEKYKNMAADAQRAGDRVNTEYYLQFADHYFRVLSEQRGRFEDQQQRRGRDDFDFEGADGLGDEFGDEGEPIRAKDQWGEQSGDRSEREGNGDGRPAREDRLRDANGDGRPRGDRDGNRDGGPREFRRERDGNGDGRRDWQDRGEGRRERRPEQPVEIAGQRRAEPLQAGESLEHRAEEVLEADRPLEPPVRRRGRPRRDDAPVNGANEANGVEADRLPPSLGLAANDEAPEAKPRRRRPRQAEDTPPAAAE